MKLQSKLWISALIVLVSGSLMAASKKKATQASAQPDEAAMQAMMKYGTPGENHKALEPYVGKWNAVARGWMKPGDKPEESTGTAENSWVLGGRFLKQEFKGTWGGQPFEGMGFTGYDNLKGEYQSVWMDGMATGLMWSTGTQDPTTKAIQLAGTFSCPMTGEKDKWSRAELKMIDATHHTYTSYFKDETGKEFKAMEITYTKADKS